MFKDERQMEDYLYLHRDKLIELLKEAFEGITDIEYIGCQVPIKRRKDVIDMLFKINNTLGYRYIIVELKNKTAPLKTISQIARYMKDYKETLEDRERPLMCCWSNQTYGVIIAPDLCKDLKEYLRYDPSDRIKGISLNESKIYG